MSLDKIDVVDAVGTEKDSGIEVSNLFIRGFGRCTGNLVGSRAR